MQEDSNLLTIPSLSQLGDLAARGMRDNPMNRYHILKPQLILEDYFDHFSNALLPSWMYEPNAIAHFLETVPSAKMFERQNTLSRFNTLTRLTATLGQVREPKVIVEVQRFQQICRLHPELVMAKKEIFQRIVERVAVAHPQWLRLGQTLAEFKALHERLSAGSHQQPVEPLGSMPLKAHKEGRRKSAATVSPELTLHPLPMF